MAVLTYLAEEGTVSVTSALATGTELFNWVMGLITANTILCAAFVLAVLVPAAVKVFKHLKNTAK